MAGQRNNARTKAAAAAVLLLLTGALLGIALDRLWFRAPANAMELTVSELSEHLDLAPAEETRMRALLDSIEPDIAAATAHGVDSLQSTALREPPASRRSPVTGVGPETRRQMPSGQQALREEKYIT